MNQKGYLPSPLSFPTDLRLLGKVRILNRGTILAFLLPFLLYLTTLAPTVYNLDSAELTTAAATGGIVRATGYPLYLLLGRLWTNIPVGDIGFRMNLFSAVWGAFTIVVMERILRRWEIGPVATFGALGLLTVSTYFWALSLIAEVYTLHTALMAVIILLLLRWAEAPAPGRLALVALAIGLSFAHHVATVLLVPGCIWYLLTVSPRSVLRPQSLVLAAFAFLLGLSVYLYLPWLYGTFPAFNYAGTYNAEGLFQPVNLRTPYGMWWLVSGRAFANVIMGYTSTELVREIIAYAIHLWRAFFAVGIGPAVLGGVLLCRRDWRLGGMMLLFFLCNALFYVNYRVVDKETMFLPTYLIWALWLGPGLQWLLDSVNVGSNTTLQRSVTFAFQLGIAAIVLLAGLTTWHQVNLSDDSSARQRGERILRQVEHDALILGWWETVPVIEYLQLVEGQRPDVEAVNRFLIPYRSMKQLIRKEIRKRPVYIDDVPSSWSREMDVEKEGVLYRLTPMGVPGVPGSREGIEGDRESGQKYRSDWVSGP